MYYRPISIIAYEDGFIVDNGAFRPLANNPQNQQFIDDINEGYCPRELMGNRKNPLPIALTDHRNKKYNAAEHKNSSDSCCGGSTSPSKPALEAFSGQARSLGGNTAQASFNANATGEVTVDPSRPSTTLRIRFHNGQQRTQTFNRDAPISQLRAFVNSVAPVSGGNFKLVTGFPPVSLDDESATLESVGVIDTTVIQHL